MSYQVFARKYRPKSFADVLGQDHVVRTLRNAIEQDRLAHAYLFVGPRGTGKTSTARIFAKALNCTNGPQIEFDPEEDICQEIAEGRSLDVLEIDGASNNGVEQVRDLIDNVKFAPARCRYKIYYIDEVHMLTKSAFNALLKTLEEPPEHVKFIFATTEPNKILPTIISRCQRFDLRPISTEVIAKHLQHIATAEGVLLDDKAAWTIAKGADGGMRDAQSMLDQLVAFCGEKITEDNVLDIFGFTSGETITSLVSALLSKNPSQAIEVIHQQEQAGKDLSHLLIELINCLRNILVSKVDPHAKADELPEDLWETLQKVSADVSHERLLHLVDIFAEADGRMKWARNKRLHFELAVIKSIQSLSEILISDVIKALGGAPSQFPSSGEALLPNTAPRVEEQKTTTPTTEAFPVEAPKTETAKIEREIPSVEAPSFPTSPELPPATLEEPLSEPATISEPPIHQGPDFIAVESYDQPEPAPQETPVKIEPVASPSPPRQSKEIDFDALISVAPEEPELPPEPVVPVTKSAPTPELVKPKEEPKTDESFYQDPLIQNALEIFKGKLLS